MKPRVWIDSVPHGERRPRSFIASDLCGWGGGPANRPSRDFLSGDPEHTPWGAAGPGASHLSAGVVRSM
jgi:hypothetical protein